MGFRFRKSVRVFPGLRLNFSGSGVSVSAGPPGATFNLGSRGASLTVGIPGSGLSYRHQFLTAPNSTPHPAGLAPPIPPSPPVVEMDGPLVGEIRSAEVAQLTSGDLQGLKTLINEAARQKAELQPDFEAALHDRRRAWSKLRRREQPPLVWMMKSSIPQARSNFEEAHAEADKVADALAASEVRIEIALEEPASRAWAGVVAAHAAMAAGHRIWDVTSSMGIDRALTRSAASWQITRKLVALRSIDDGIIAGAQGLRIENANGGDLDIFAGVILMRAKGLTDYALIDLRDLEIEARAIQFIEDEPVSQDSEVIGQAWAKSNKDGSRDRRYADNHQIPIVRYGRIEFASAGGLREAYMVSDPNLALRFAEAFESFKAAIREQASRSPSADEPWAGMVAPAPSRKPLPDLPKVAGAYELFFLPAALALAPFVATSWQQKAAAPSLPLAVAAMPSSTGSPSPSAPTPSTSTVVTTLAPAVASNVPNAASQTTPKSAETQPISDREKLALLQNANVRAAPDRAATSLRIALKDTTVFVFKREGAWVEIGYDTPWGWVHSSLLQKR